jgi:hypothetical protein
VGGGGGGGGYEGLQRILMQPPSWLGTVYSSTMGQNNSVFCKSCPCYGNRYDMEQHGQVNVTTDSRPAPIDCTREVGRLQCGCCVLSVKVIHLIL